MTKKEILEKYPHYPYQGEVVKGDNITKKHCEYPDLSNSSCQWLRGGICKGCTLIPL